LLCGTNLYQRDWESALTPSILNRIHVPVIPFGVGSSAASLDEQQVGRKTRDMIVALHGKCSAGSVRDPHTEGIVRRAGVDNASLTGCPVLFWSNGPSAPQFHSGRCRRLVITARNWLMHRWPDEVDHPVQIDFLRRIVSAFADDEVIFAIHEDFDERLVPTLGLSDSVVRRSVRHGDLIPLYEDPDNVVLAMRLHAGMLSVANGVSALFIGHDTRTYSFCDMVGLRYIDLFDPEAADEAIARLRAMLRGDTTEFGALPGNFERLHESMAAFLEVNRLPARAGFMKPAAVERV
jgi:hypothetical protein